jgi:YbbR domain-containing protein
LAKSATPRRGEQKVPVKVETKLEDVEMVGAKPSEIAVKLDTAARRKFGIEAEFDLAPTWQVTNTALETQSAKVAGASQTLARVKKVRALVESKVSAPGALQFGHVALEAVDKNGNVVSDLEIEPKTVRVRATIAERQEEKAVPVEVLLKGRAARGYAAGAIEVEPARVTLRGPQRILAKITAVEAELDLHDARHDRERRIRLTAPEGTEFVSRDSVQVRVSIAALPAAASTPPASADATTNPESVAEGSSLPQPALPKKSR